MRGLINKKGAAHLEMIFSVVFFVGFIFFLFVVLKPQDTSTLSGAVIEALYDSFKEDVYTNLSTVLLKANYTGSSDCFIIDLPENIFSYSPSDCSSYVTTLSGKDVMSKLEGSGNLDISNNDKFFRVAISPEFDDDNIASCGSLDYYELGQVVERKVVSYKALKSMSDRYDMDYEGLRSDLKVPSIFDFAIITNISDIMMEPKLGIPDSVEVVAKDYIVEVLKSNGEVSNERFTVKIW